jgi:GT2 family glycosyltransferase
VDYKAIKNCGVLAPMDTGSSRMLETTYDDHWWACVLIEMWKWWKVGPFDESLPLAYHDQDWSIRCKLAGFEICRTGNVVVEHVNMATRNRMPRDGEAQEIEEMIRRWGTSEFRDWARLNEGKLHRWEGHEDRIPK